MRSFPAALAAAVLCAAGPPLSAQTADALGPLVLRFVSVASRRVVLAHVTVIDGTGGPARADQDVTIEDGRIAAISPAASAPPRDGVTVLDLRGRSVLPGIVGMHDHLFCLTRPNLAPDGTADSPGLFRQMSFSAPRLYLASGVTTIRTTGSIEPVTELKLKRDVERGVLPGPHMDVTGPYLEGGELPLPQIRELTGPDDARQTVAYWADRGVTSFKAYKHITRDELRAAIDEAHRRGLKVTAHLCSVTYEEAAELGIDDLEHGFEVNTSLDAGKKADTCSESGGDETLEKLVPGSPEATRLITTLVKHRVAVTSTLPALASTLPGGSTARPAVLDAMAPSVRDAFLYANSRAPNRDAQAKNALLLRRDMDLQRAFVAAGGLLLAGPDPVGVGGNLPGFGDQREIELLVEAGFTPVEAIRVATLNGATFLGRQDRIGSLAAGRNADLVVVKGDPTARIADIENVEIVFKDGVGYDPKKLLESVKGRYGEY